MRESPHFLFLHLHLSDLHCCLIEQISAMNYFPSLVYDIVLSMDKCFPVIAMELNNQKQ